jgi:nucleotide-binding universal stress UspA family protein
VEFQQHSHQAEPLRLLVAADASVDPHRLVRLCCERAGDDGLGVSLLVPVDDYARPSSEVTAMAERLLQKSAGLLDAAGIRLEDVTLSAEDTDAVDEIVRSGGFDALFVCATHQEASSPVLQLAARLARLHGLPVIASALHSGHGSWLRRLVDPLLHWSRD